MPRPKTEVVRAAAGASRLFLSPSERYLTIERKEEYSDAPPALRVLDRQDGDKQGFAAAGWAAGRTDDSGELLYVERSGPRWALRSSTRTSEKTPLAPPSDRSWSFVTATRTGGHVVAFFTDAAPRQPTVWAASIEASTLEQVATTTFAASAGFAHASVAAQSKGTMVFWTKRTAEREISLAAHDAATLHEKWSVALPIKTPNGPPVSPDGSVTVTGDGALVFVSVGDRRRGSVSSDAIYGVRTADGSVAFGPSPESLQDDVWLQNIYSAAPVPASSSVALLLVFNLRDEPDKFFRIRVVDVEKATVTSEIEKSVTTHAIAVRRSGQVLIAPAP